MSPEIGTYDTQAAKRASLKSILDILADFGAKNVYAKKLAPNDNSKNQPYFGPHLTDLPFIPTGDIEATETTSNKITATKDDKRKIKFLASMKLAWIDAEGRKFPAPHAKLIYYPQYPEVRFSGFLRGSKVKASRWMSPDKEGRSEGRWLIIGVAKDQSVFAYLVTPESALANELETSSFYKISSVFVELSSLNKSVTSARDTLITELLKIHKTGWIRGQKLNLANGIKEPYTARNAGGYTLEAELGIVPNGVAEPDFHGWEVKQFGVKNFPNKGAGPTTLFTPEPNGGIYGSMGAEEFVRRYGYPDRNGIPDRLNFGGVHRSGIAHDRTKLTLKLLGFDKKSGKMTDSQGSVALLDATNTIAASWSFAKVMDHWKRKHAQAVYIPCLSRDADGGGKEYYYGSDIELGTGTDFEMFLTNMSAGYVYYDPGIKLENASTNQPKTKRRSQFRIAHKLLPKLYKKFEFLDISDT